MSNTTYTRNDFLKLALNDELIAEEIFEAVAWQRPETWLDEQFRDGEFDVCSKCERIFSSYNSSECPHCGCENKEKE